MNRTQVHSPVCQEDQSSLVRSLPECEDHTTPNEACYQVEAGKACLKWTKQWQHECAQMQALFSSPGLLRADVHIMVSVMIQWMSFILLLLFLLLRIFSTTLFSACATCQIKLRLLQSGWPSVFLFHWVLEPPVPVWAYQVDKNLCNLLGNSGTVEARRGQTQPLWTYLPFTQPHVTQAKVSQVGIPGRHVSNMPTPGTLQPPATGLLMPSLPSLFVQQPGSEYKHEVAAELWHFQKGKIKEVFNSSVRGT